MFEMNPLLNADAYKFGHKRFYPEGVEEVYSNFTPRSTRHFKVPRGYEDGKIVAFGNQAVARNLVETWDHYFFKRDIDEVIAEFDEEIAPFAGANYDSSHFVELHKLGYLPLVIKILPEGTVIDAKIPVLTVRNTRPDFYWLTNFLEDWFSAESWHPSTVATIARMYRKIGTDWYIKTGANLAFLDFAFHDFSLRGHTSLWSGTKAGSGHQAVFIGTDTVQTSPYVKYFYTDPGVDLVGGSVPATEHSIQCAFVEDDKEYIRKIIKEDVPNGIVSVVVDGYDYWNVIENIVPELMPEILSRGEDEYGNSKVVFRPDSGNPADIICGVEYEIFEDCETLEEVKEWAVDSVHDIINETHTDAYNPGDNVYELIIKWKGEFYKAICNLEWNRHDKTFYFLDYVTIKSIEPYERTIEEKGTVEALWDQFGGIENEMGFKEVMPRVGVIYGDSITLDVAVDVFRRLFLKGFAANNVVFGIGSFTYQMVTRDTLGYAMKATNIIRDGESIPLFKNPKTDKGMKKSARGYLAVLDKDGGPTLEQDVSKVIEGTGMLQTFFDDGEIVYHDTITTVRKRIKESI